MKVEYYYSIASPFSYLALERFLSLVKKYNLEIDEKPVDLVGEIFSNTGGLPVPKRHPSRQKYRLIEIDRIAKKFNVPINNQPKFFPPSDPHLPAKFVIAACKKGDKLNFSNTCLEYLWALEKDISDYDIHIQFVDTHGVDGDSASITIATAVISALEDIPIRQDLAMTGSLSVRGEVLPIGGVTAKIEAAAGSGIKKVIVPRSNMQDVLLDDKYKDMVEVVAVDSLDEVMKHALIKHEHKESLVERLSSVIDILTPEVSNKSPSA